jgi:hypothetical protein
VSGVIVIMFDPSCLLRMLMHRLNALTCHFRSCMFSCIKSSLLRPIHCISASLTAIWSLAHKFTASLAWHLASAALGSSRSSPSPLSKRSTRR